MKLKNLSSFEFDKYAEAHPLGSYHQTSNYAELAKLQGYTCDFLGLVDDNDIIQAAALILTKKIGLFNRYGYSPKGFLVDYYNPTLLQEFVDKVKNYYGQKNFAFIKINPEISIGSLDYENKTIKYNKNQMIESTLKGLGFKKLEGHHHFETKLPQFNAIQILKNTNLNTLSKNTRNKIKKATRLGMKLVEGKKDDIAILYNFIKNKKEQPIDHYFNYYNAFSKDNSIDIMLVEIDFEECLINLRERYEEEMLINEKLTNLSTNNPSKENLIKKQESDSILSSIKDNITFATNHLTQNRKEYIAGAITIKYRNRVNILISGYNKSFSRFCPNYFLHYALINHYKDDYDYIDLNGITGDFSEENPYKGLDEFKKGFNPLAFVYIGEYDYIINEDLYKNMIAHGQLTKEFKRKEKSIKN